MGKKKAANVSISNIENKITKDFGENVIVSGNYISESSKIVVPVSPMMDMMLGGGIPFGSFVIPTGPPKVGKTATALDVAGSALGIKSEWDNPRELYFFNIEGRLNKRDLLGIHHLAKYLKDNIKIIGSVPGKILTAENYLDIGEQLINEKPGCIFIFDSFSQLCSKSGRENEWDGKQYRDDVPKFLSLLCKRISNVIPINKSIVIGITHRIANTGFGFSSWAEASGTKIQYQVDVKLNAKYCEAWKEGDVQIGQDIHWDCFCAPLLNGPTQGNCVSKLRYGYGLDKPSELISVAVDLGILQQKGAWYYYEDSSFHGAKKIRDFVANTEKVYNEINSKYREMMGFPK